MQAAANKISPGTVLIAYDTILTLSNEITYIWQKKVKLGTVLYCLARYPILVVTLLNVIQPLFNVSLQVCLLSLL